MGFVVTTLTIALHSSLSHEVLHGHPFENQRLNEALVWIQPNLVIPYARFRDTHLAHHQDASLTDPYDDPESNYLDPAVWANLPAAMRWVWRANNTLMGRIVIGSALGVVLFIHAEWRLIRAGNRKVLRAWIEHLAGAALVTWWIVSISSMPLWLYFLAAYAGLSLIKIRTFLEHQAHEKSRARTVIVEDRGPLAFLFLNNNLHVVHHMHPGAPWYKLPSLYRDKKNRYLELNDGYVFRSYGEVFARYILQSKDPVAHPLWPNR
ncbi:MAG: fatty acid desaturase [Tateyamaria sp.]